MKLQKLLLQMSILFAKGENVMNIKLPTYFMY